MATPAVMMLANRGLAFTLYEFHLEGIPVQDLATGYSLPVEWVEKRIEAVRLRLKYQNQFTARPMGSVDSAV
jgi:hypothetical protein